MLTIEFVLSSWSQDQVIGHCRLCNRHLHYVQYCYNYVCLNYWNIIGLSYLYTCILRILFLLNKNVALLVVKQCLYQYIMKR